MSKQLTGKVALVTGGSRGIGAATALALADEGASVAISYVASDEKALAMVAELEKKGVRAEAFKADQGNADEAESLIRRVHERFGRLDVLVNNAGLFVMGTIDGTNDTAALARQHTVNVVSVVAAVKAAVKVMAQGGRIINVGSVLGAQVNYAGLSDYAASKAAVAAYSKGWARDLGAKGITVNVVQPGPIATDMNPDSGAFADLVRPRTALGRFGKAEEVAATIAFLASPAASYVTGAVIDVDGGLSA